MYCQSKGRNCGSFFIAFFSDFLPRSPLFHYSAHSVLAILWAYLIFYYAAKIAFLAISLGALSTSDQNRRDQD